MKFAIISNDNRVLFSTIAENCNSCIMALNKEYENSVCPNNDKKCRRSAINYNGRKLLMCSQSFRTTKNYKDAIQVYVSVIPFIEQTIEDIRQQSEKAEQNFTKSLLHNLVNQNAHNIQILDQFLPQNERFAEVSATITNTRNKIINAPDKVALALFKLKKIASSMKAEFSAYDRFRKGNTSVSPKVYKLYDVVKIVVHIFFADLHDNNVYVKIDQCYEKGYFDFEVMRVALYYIFENAAKYTKPDSQIEVDFNKTETEDNHCINITMESLYVEPEEVAHIFEKGFSGNSALKADKAGTGLGMYHAKELINLSNGDIIFTAGSKISSKYRGNRYAMNNIRIIIPAVPKNIVLYQN